MEGVEVGQFAGYDPALGLLLGVGCTRQVDKDNEVRHHTLLLLNHLHRKGRGLIEYQDSYFTSKVGFLLTSITHSNKRVNNIYFSCQNAMKLD